MGRVSRKRINPWVEERMFELFWQLLATIRTTSDIREFFQSLLSYTEQMMLAKRLSIALLLYRDYRYEDISKLLKVSTSTVAIVHKAILTGASGYKKAVSIIEKQEQQEAFWQKLDELLLRLSMPAHVDSSRFQQKSAQGVSLYKRKRKRELL